MTTPLRGLIAAALMSTTSSLALAQAPLPARPTPSPAAAASAPQAAAVPGYRSVFDGHRRFERQQVLPWRESNDLVGRLGGRHADPHQAASGEAMPVGHHMHKPTSAAASTPAPSPHAGHTSPKTP